jgi:hypothetical protein
MSNGPLDPRDRGYRDDVRGTDDVRTTTGYDRVYDAPVDAGAYGAEPVVVREPYLVGVRNGAGTAALVLGILGLLTSWLLVGGVLGVFAVICGFVGIGRANRREATNHGSAVAGVVLGLLAIAVSIAVGVAGKSFYDRNKGTISNLNNCLKTATTADAQNACRTQFQDTVTK